MAYATPGWVYTTPAVLNYRLRFVGFIILRLSRLELITFLRRVGFDRRSVIKTVKITPIPNKKAGRDRKNKNITRYKLTNTVEYLVSYSHSYIKYFNVMEYNRR